MNKKLAILSAAALLAGISGAASASDHVSFSISFGAPAYVAPPAAYYRPLRFTMRRAHTIPHR